MHARVSVFQMTPANADAGIVSVERLEIGYFEQV